ncbi:hypothetical protein CEXT_595171 [Caerostris extrusa]|uniref:Uncharacterized protein n=1 Tax=Caerostris extrusa TaxID=172846 RepID=A0AAV4PGH2_CAEEX|nr:hypothetical protein CEXT_595171 [Caerostris extrusa]
MFAKGLQHSKESVFLSLRLPGSLSRVFFFFFFFFTKAYLELPQEKKRKKEKKRRGRGIHGWLTPFRQKNYFLEEGSWHTREERNFSFLISPEKKTRREKIFAVLKRRANLIGNSVFVFYDYDVVDLLYADHLLMDDYTLIDVAYIYLWKRTGPMEFLYTFTYHEPFENSFVEPPVVMETEKIGLTNGFVDEPDTIAVAVVSDENISVDEPVAEENAMSVSDSNEVVNGHDSDEAVGDSDSIIDVVNDNETIATVNGNDVIEAVNGHETIATVKDSEKVATVNGNETIATVNGNETIATVNGNETIATVNGNETIATVNGNETIAIVNGNERIEVVDEDSESIDVVNVDEKIEAVNGNDMIATVNGNDKIEAVNGNEKIATVNGNNRIEAVNGNESEESMAVCESNNNVVVSESNAVVTVSESNRTINGTQSNDTPVVDAIDESNRSEVPAVASSVVEETNSRHHELSIASSSSKVPDDTSKMEIDEVSSSTSSPTMNTFHSSYTPIMKVDATYTLQNILSPTNGIKLKLIHCPDAKRSSKKSGGRKSSRTRYKSTPVQRFPRLAPYPPPPSTPTVCLPTTNISPLPQITMSNLVPSVMTTLSPNIVTALVSTTANTMCDVTKNSTMLPTAAFLSQSPLCTHTSHSFAAVPNFIPVSTAAMNSILPNVSGTGMTLKSILPQPTVVGSPTPSSTVIQQSIAEKTTKSITAQQTYTMPCVTISVSVPTSSVSKESTHISTPVIYPSMPVFTTDAKQPKPVVSPIAAAIAPKVDSASLLKVALTEEHVSGSKAPPKDNGIQSSPIKQSLFCDALTPEKKTSTAFEMSVKNSISAEFSDNDDLGCQSDLVVDEQKMDSSDNEDDTDVALRKKITAIAEKEDEADATDDTEADSGRASDISSQARSSCDDDIGSPMNTMSVSESATSTSAPRLPTFSFAVSTAASTPATTAHPDTRSIITSHSNTVISNTSRNVKSNNINHVINNILRNHEKKDTIGALDLSSYAKKPAEVVFRPKPVANPVLDIKHRQQTYLPAPNTNKQHTACVPAPKHPTSSPILMHGLTAHRNTLMSTQISPAPPRKSPHLPIPPIYGGSMFPSQSSDMSPPSCMPAARSAPTYANHPLSPPAPSAHQGMPASVPMLSSMLPCINRSMANSFPLRSATPLPSAMPARSNPSSIAHVTEGKPYYTKGTNRAPRTMVSPTTNSLIMPTTNSLIMPTTNSLIMPTTNSLMMPTTNSLMMPTTNSLMMPYPITSAIYKSNHPTIPSYNKRSNSYKNAYNGKYAVINQSDPNGYQNKMLVRNLDARPNSNQQLH